MDKIQCAVKPSKILLILGYLGVSCYLLYIYAEWWMFFCALLGGFVQFGALMALTDCKRKIEISEAEKHVKILKRYPNVLKLHCAILSVLNLFPLIITFYPIPFPCPDWDGGIYWHNVRYEGGILVTFIVIFVVICYIGVLIELLSDYRKSINLLNSEIEYFRRNGISRHKACQIKQEEEKQEKRNKLKVLYGEDYKVVPYDDHLPECKIIYSHKEERVTIKGKEYRYAEIEGCSIIDKSLVIERPSSETYTTKTNMGSMLGRAVVGGVLTGGVGAVIGAATAKKETIKESGNPTHFVNHNYNIQIYIKNQKSPIEIRMIKSYTIAKRIEECINRILDYKNGLTKTEVIQENSKQYTEAEALDRLVELKKKETLTDEEQREYETLRKRIIKDL